jgi:secreted trypsin-like serine protease
MLVLLGGACSETTIQLVEVAERESAIVNGTTYSGHPSVGMLQIGYSGLCTATLIGQRTVITAAHCIGSSHSFKVGGQTYPAASAKKHPNWNSYTLENDIAIVILQQAPTGVSPSVIATSAPTVGTEITLVGYGVTGEGLTNSGTKRMAKNKISQLSTTRFAFAGSSGSSGSTCYGDSGGPAFATLGGVEVQIGVTSAGQKPCGTLAYDTRVDAFASWIEQTASGDVNKGGTAPDPNPAPNPSPSPSPSPSPNPTDTTAPVVTITSPAAGAAVQTPLTVAATITDNVGVTKAELLVDGAVISTKTAAPYDFQVNLAAGTHTIQVTGHDAAGNKGSSSVSVSLDAGATPSPAPSPDPSPAPAPAAGEYGAPCQTASDCTSGLCAEDPGFEGKYCTQGCDPNGAACPLGAGCFATNVAGKSVCGAPAQSLPIIPGDNAGGEAVLAGSCSLARTPSAEGALGALLLLLTLLSLRVSARRSRSRRRRGRR